MLIIFDTVNLILIILHKFDNYNKIDNSAFQKLRQSIYSVRVPLLRASIISLQCQMFKKTFKPHPLINQCL